MCQFKSFIATKDRLYHVNGLDSHEDIVMYYDLPDKLDRDGQVQIPSEDAIEAEEWEQFQADLMEQDKEWWRQYES